MMTIVTDVELKRGAETQWDSTMRERMTAAEKLPGWVAGQLLSPAEQPHRRLIVGTWRTRADWQRWHEDPLFEDTRRTLDTLTVEPARHTWHDVVLDVRRPGAGGQMEGARRA